VEERTKGGVAIISLGCDVYELPMELKEVVSRYLSLATFMHSSRETAVAYDYMHTAQVHDQIKP
jgi:hypothetical protein